MRYSILLAGIATASLFAADVKVMEEIIAKVNGDIVTRTDIDRDRRTMEATMKQQGASAKQIDETMQQASPNLLRERIDQLLLMQKAKELNLNVDTDVNKELAEIQRKVTAENPAMADPEKFQAFVREQTGMPYEDYKGETKNRYLSQRVVREEVGQKIKVKKEELRAYYDEHLKDFIRQERVFLREILVGTQGKTDADSLTVVEKKAKDLVANARKGARFPEMAQQSSDSVTAQFGGALDPYTKGALDPAIENQVWDKERGYVTDPIKVAAGWLILKVDDHQKAGQAAYEEVEQEIQNRMFEQRMEPSMRAYLTKLRENAFLEIKEGYADAGAAPGKVTKWTDPAELKPQTIDAAVIRDKGHRKRLLWTIPVPGTKSSSTGTSSSR